MSNSKRFAWILIGWCLLAMACLSQAQVPMTGAGLGKPTPATGCAQAASFLAAVAGQSGNYQTAFTTLICGLVTDGVYAKLDCAFPFKAHESATALTTLNLSANCTGSNTSATFTADQGFTGNGTTAFIDSGFNPTTATTPQFAQNAASVFVYSNTSAAESKPISGWLAAATTSMYIYARNVGDIAALEINSTGADIEPASTDGSGLWTITRTTSTLQTAYRNSTSLGTETGMSSAAPKNTTVVYLADLSTNDLGFSTRQVAFAGVGGALTGSDVTALSGRIATYLASVP